MLYPVAMNWDYINASPFAIGEKSGIHLHSKQ